MFETADLEMSKLITLKKSTRDKHYGNVSILTSMIMCHFTWFMQIKPHILFLVTVYKAVSYKLKQKIKSLIINMHYKNIHFSVNNIVYAIYCIWL